MTAGRKAIFKEALLQASVELSEKLGFLPSLPSGPPHHLINQSHGFSPQKHR
jgi:hypothetical protein